MFSFISFRSNDERVRDLQNPSGSHGTCKVVLYLDFDFCADKVLVLLRIGFLVFLKCAH